MKVYRYWSIAEDFQLYVVEKLDVATLATTSPVVVRLMPHSVGASVAQSTHWWMYVRLCPTPQRSV
jgi:hypothetical protein